MLTGGQGQVSDFDLAKNLSDPRITTTKAYTLAYVARKYLRQVSHLLLAISSDGNQLL